MLAELRISGLGVIDEAVVPFGPGLTVLTGETGAGKTMVLTGLALLMGEKADPGAVRTGSGRATVDGEWLLDGASAAAALARLDEAGADVEEEGGLLRVVLGRQVAVEGRSRAFAGGRPVPSATLADVSGDLVAVHGQSDQVLLRDPRQQRALLDRFGGPSVAESLDRFREAFARWRSASRELDELVRSRDELQREASALRLGIEEVAAVDPQPGEDEALKALAQVLSHAADLVAEAGAARALLAEPADGDSASVADLLAGARRSLERAAGLDPSLSTLLARLAALSDEVDDLSAELGRYVGDTEADPARLASVEDRRQRLSALKRRFGPELDDVLAWWRTAQETVARADGADDRLADLERDTAAARADVVARAADLSAARAAAAGRFAQAVTQELHALAMADAEVSIDLTVAAEPEEYTPDGADAVAILLRPHQGSDPRPLGRGASGGELSRVMLAIEVVLAGVHAVPTFVFDEVDAGIGGRVAVEVGRRLARLARSAQVIVVTHLPQVAAFATQHLVVTKGTDGAVTAASITSVDGEDRVRELVRMLSGLEDSASGAEHAGELLALAAAEQP